MGLASVSRRTEALAQVTAGTSARLAILLDEPPAPLRGRRSQAEAACDKARVRQRVDGAPADRARVEEGLTLPKLIAGGVAALALSLGALSENEAKAEIGYSPPPA